MPRSRRGEGTKHLAIQRVVDDFDPIDAGVTWPTIDGPIVTSLPGAIIVGDRFTIAIDTVRTEDAIRKMVIFGIHLKEDL